MADMEVEIGASVQLGGESKFIGFDVARTLEDVGTVVFDATINVPANFNGASNTTLWTAASHGGTGAEEFDFGIIIPDPDEVYDTEHFIHVQKLSTITGGATVITHDPEEISSRWPLLFMSDTGTAITSLAAATSYDISKLTATNPHATDAVKVRVVLFNRE